VCVNQSLMLHFSSGLLKSIAVLHVISGNKRRKSISVLNVNSAQNTTKNETVIPTVSFHKHNWKNWLQQLDVHIYAELGLSFVLLNMVYETKINKTSRNDRWSEKKMLEMMYNLKEQYLVFSVLSVVKCCLS
jgi:hypothetical protein